MVIEFDWKIVPKFFFCFDLPFSLTNGSKFRLHLSVTSESSVGGGVGTEGNGVKGSGNKPQI